MCGKIVCFVTAFSQLTIGKHEQCWPAVTAQRDPRKPFLLLSVLDLVAQRKITKEFVEVSSSLAETFNRYWQEIMPSGSSDNFGHAFCHLDDEPFWTLVPKRGVVQPEGEKDFSNKQLRKYYLGARLDKELFPLLLMEPLRRRLREALVQTYFAQEVQAVLMEQGRG